jgi:hypothetical protein
MNRSHLRGISRLFCDEARVVEAAPSPGSVGRSSAQYRPSAVTYVGTEAMVKAGTTIRDEVAALVKSGR